MGFCGFIYGNEPTSGVEGWAFGGSNMGGIAASFSGWIRQHVVNQTNVAGRFRFYLEFASLPRVIGNPFDGQVAPPPDTPASAPDFYTAIKEQLGLQLVETAKGPLQFIVIDHVERPSEN